MALTPNEQELLDFALASLPAWFQDDAAAMEFLGGCAKLFGAARDQSDYWFGQALITGADGATATTPDWLGQHAVDRGSRRQASEDDVVLRERLRNVPDALHRQSILDAAQAILDAAGVAGDAAMVELRKDRAYFLVNEPMEGTGGTISGGGPYITIPTTRDFQCLDEINPAATVHVVAGTFTYQQVINQIQGDLAAGWVFTIDEDGRASFYFPDSIFSVRWELLEDATDLRDVLGFTQGDAIDWDPNTQNAYEGVDLVTDDGDDGPLRFTPDDLPWPRPPFQSLDMVPFRRFRLTLSGAADPDNDGTFDVDGVVEDGAAYVNTDASTGHDATIDWRVDRWDSDVDGAQLTEGTGRADAYLSRGFRMGSSVATIVLILPFGTTEGTRLAVLEMLRQKKAAGVRAYVERRLNP